VRERTSGELARRGLLRRRRRHRPHPALLALQCRPLLPASVSSGGLFELLNRYLTALYSANSVAPFARLLADELANNGGITTNVSSNAPSQVLILTSL
jgi:hypothetical protein